MCERARVCDVPAACIRSVRVGRPGCNSSLAAESTPLGFHIAYVFKESLSAKSLPCGCPGLAAGLHSMLTTEAVIGLFCDVCRLLPECDLYSVVKEYVRI